MSRSSVKRSDLCFAAVERLSVVFRSLHHVCMALTINIIALAALALYLAHQQQNYEYIEEDPALSSAKGIVADGHEIGK